MGDNDDITDRYEYINFVEEGCWNEVASRIEANVKILTFASIRGSEVQRFMVEIWEQKAEECKKIETAFSTRNRVPGTLNQLT